MNIGLRTANFTIPKNCCILSMYTRALHGELSYYLITQCGRQGRGGGGFMGWVIRIIFDPNTRQWGGGGGFMR